MYFKRIQETTNKSVSSRYWKNYKKKKELTGTLPSQISYGKAKRAVAGGTVLPGSKFFV